MCYFVLMAMRCEISAINTTRQHTQCQQCVRLSNLPAVNSASVWIHMCVDVCGDACARGLIALCCEMVRPVTCWMVCLQCPVIGVYQSELSTNASVTLYRFNPLTIHSRKHNKQHAPSATSLRTNSPRTVDCHPNNC